MVAAAAQISERSIYVSILCSHARCFLISQWHPSIPLYVPCLGLLSLVPIFRTLTYCCWCVAVAPPHKPRTSGTMLPPCGLYYIIPSSTRHPFYIIAASCIIRGSIVGPSPTTICSCLCHSGSCCPLSLFLAQPYLGRGFR